MIIIISKHYVLQAACGCSKLRLEIWKAWCRAQAHQHKSVTSARRARQGHERACASVVTRSQALPSTPQCHFHTNENDDKAHNQLYLNTKYNVSAVSNVTPAVFLPAPRAYRLLILDKPDAFLSATYMQYIIV